MALNPSNPFASFDMPDGSQTRDISNFLQAALYFDFHLLSKLPIAWDDPIFDPQYYWNEDALNADTVTTSASVAGGGTSISLSAGHGTRVHVGDLVKDTTAGATEVKQVTAISTDTLTVTANVNGTASSAIANGDTLALMRTEQESSDIGSDKSVAPTVRSNFSHIIAGAFELQVSGSELMREMATDQLKDQVAHQLENRMIEFKKQLTKILLYSERVGPGSDTVYRSLGGIRYWINSNGGQTNTVAQALTTTNLNAVNDPIVALGGYPNLLGIGTGLAGSVNAIDASNRRLLESETQVGYIAQAVLLGQGNLVEVCIDGRIDVGDAFLLDTARIKPRPGRGRGMFTIAATDFADAKKRRILGEWGLELRNPSVHAYLSNKT